MYEIKTLSLPGVTLAYKEFGTGDRYLLSTQNFFFNGCHAELLGKPPYDYHCFLVYMRGYGRSSHITDPTPKNYAAVWGDDLLLFADAMGIDSFYYTGISHGAWAGWHTAFNAPRRLRGFVCCDGIVQYPKSGPPPRMPGYQESPERLVGNRRALEKMAWMENWKTNDPQRLARRAQIHAEHTEILMSRSKEEFSVPNLADMTGCNAASPEELYQRLSEISAPVLVWQGGLDPLAKAEDALRVAQAIPGASLLTYQHLGHGGADECPELAARDCDRFFRDTENRIL